MEKKILNAETRVQVIELHKIDKELSGNYLIHLTADDWKKAIHNIPVVDFDDKSDHAENGLLVVPVNSYDPDSGVIVFPSGCPNGCTKKISFNDPFGRCDCPPIVNPPGGGGSGSPGPQKLECHPTRGANGIIACLGAGCHGCRPERRQMKIGKIVIAERIVCNCK